MKITVTKKDIELGKKFCPFSCPIARAINRKNNFHAVEVSGHIFFKNQIIIPSKKVINFIFNFDKGNKVKPFSFNLKVKK